MSVFLKLENTGWHWGPGGFFRKGVKPVCGKCFLGICCACPQFYVPLSFPLSTGSSSPPSSPYCVSLCRNTWTTRGQLMAKWISLIASMMRDDGSSGAPLMLTAAVRDAALNHSKNIIKPSPSRTNAAAWLCCSAILNSSLTKKKKKKTSHDSEFAIISNISWAKSPEVRRLQISNCWIKWKRS